MRFMIVLSDEARDGLKEMSRREHRTVREQAAHIVEETVREFRENEERLASSTPKICKWRIEPVEMYALPEAQSRVLSDAQSDLMDWLIEKSAGRAEEA